MHIFLKFKYQSLNVNRQKDYIQPTLSFFWNMNLINVCRFDINNTQYIENKTYNLITADHGIICSDLMVGVFKGFKVLKVFLFFRLSSLLFHFDNHVHYKEQNKQISMFHPLRKRLI